jgi:hypothetical protein
MDMVGYAADALRKTAQAANGTSQIIVESLAPLWGDARSAALRAEDEMIMEAEIRRWHDIRLQG